MLYQGREPTGVVARAPARSVLPIACVLGDTDLVRPLGLAGIRVATVTRPDSPKAYSRFVEERIEWADNWQDPEGLLANLLAFAATQPEPPVLMYQYDGDLLFVSRRRDELREAFRFVVGDADLVERLVDKTRFQELAGSLGLPVPTTVVLRAGNGATSAADLPLEPPVVVKPIVRRDVLWRPLAGRAKALLVESRAELASLWPTLTRAGVDVVVQEHVPGGEERIESYHAYVDEDGEVVGEFTGRKIRTLPPRFGQTTACEITDAADVRELGRECMAALGLVGVAKLDFKRAPSGRLVLLEVNPRFNLWHHPGAVAGVNLPALVYADLAGLPRPSARGTIPGVRWSLPWHDYRAARASALPRRSWLAWEAGCETRHILAGDDPMPFVRGFAWRRLKRRLRRARR